MEERQNQTSHWSPFRKDGVWIQARNSLFGEPSNIDIVQPEHRYMHMAHPDDPTQHRYDTTLDLIRFRTEYSNLQLINGNISVYQFETSRSRSRTPRRLSKTHSQTPRSPISSFYRDSDSGPRGTIDIVVIHQR